MVATAMRSVSGIECDSAKRTVFFSPRIFKNTVLSGIGEKYGKSSAQVILRWLIQRGIVVIPKSVKIERMKQNFDIFDFALAPDDMAAIAALDTGKTLFSDHRDDSMVKRIINWMKDNTPKQ